MKREDVWFDSWGERCAAWFYPAQGTNGAGGRPPCVVLAHGWTGVREQRLDAFAERFAAAGLAALVFDYRHFGASEGEPRQLLDIRRQHEDWVAAVAYARTRGDVDPDRIALWGSSFSGGHVVSVAARDRRIAAAVAQVPFADGFGNLLRLGKLHALKLTAAGLRDQLSALFGGDPYYVPSVGPPGSLAVMNTPDAEPGFRATNPPDFEWRNEAAARVALRVGLYRPTRNAPDVRCPVLFAIATDDAITPPDLAEREAARMRRAELRFYPGGHFDPYVPPLFDEVVADQVEFLTRHLLGAGERAPAAAQAV